MRTGQIAAMLLTALALEGCYAQYNYRPTGYEDGWTMGHHAGHLGWYDQYGHWRGWFDGASWHDAHEKPQPAASPSLPAPSASVGGMASGLRGPARLSTAKPSAVKSPTPASVSSPEETPSAINPVPDATQVPAPQRAPITPPAAVPSPLPVAVPAQAAPVAPPPALPAVAPAIPHSPAPVSAPPSRSEPVVQPVPAQPEPVPSAEPPAPVQTPNEDEMAPSTTTAPEAPFRIKSGTSMPQGPDESTSAASQILPAWLSPSPDPVSTTPSEHFPSKATGRTTHRATP
ncbi:hypothetical protein [Acetobacter sp.]|jgi:hypothetical protein|uniref:hypothetical protein n=1 Tax=Acetobacter sp. TaxID=440 RepID=UPI0025BD06C6|nr:hypothetical protein [Acetobacter sp.]MCH4091525.1 hypothetical protein [Acetobacter sp.]MCI1299503.1 hypothetical protein [Acetobacter sp.]MCI1316907.1 hypothetical protein [Acetobacter sp.]